MMKQAQDKNEEVDPEILDKIEIPDPPMHPQERIKMWFVYSQMTVRNEKTQRGRYEYLKYVEFLEFFCRAAYYFG